MIFSIGLVMTVIVLLALVFDIEVSDALGSLLVIVGVMGVALMGASALSWAIDNVGLLSWLRALP